MSMLQRLAAALLCTGAAVAQLPLPSGLDGTCDLATLDARVSVLNRVCCFAEGPAGSRCSAQNQECTLDCAVALLPLLAECGPVLDALYSGRTIVSLVPPIIYTHHFFDAVYASCLELSEETVLQGLLRAVDSGACNVDSLDGIALTQVVTDCADTNENCASIISMGGASLEAWRVVHRKICLY